MTTYYADAQNGSDSNGGTSWADAKATLAAARAAMSNGDICFCRGVFSAGPGSMASQEKTFIGRGARLTSPLFGTGTAWNGGSANGWTMNVSGFIMNGWEVAFEVPRSSAYLTVDNCVIRDCDYAIKADPPSLSTPSSGTLENCLIESCVNGLYLASSSPVTTIILRNCSFVAVTNPVLLTVNSSSNRLVAKNNYIDSGVAYSVAGTSPVLTLNYNGMDASTSFHYNGTDYSTLAAWQSAASEDADSVELAGDINDATKLGGGWPVPGASCNLLGINGHGEPGGPYGNLGYGVQRSTLTLSTNKNASLWTGGVFSDTEVDGNGDIILSGAATSGYWRSDVIDLGAADDVFAIDFGIDSEDAANPATFRIRYSNTAFAKADATPEWSDYLQYSRLADYLAPTYQYRYWQVEVNLNG